MTPKPPPKGFKPTLEAPPTAVVPTVEKPGLAGVVDATKQKVAAFVRRARNLPSKEQLHEVATLDQPDALDSRPRSEEPVISEQRKDDLATVCDEAREYVDRINDIGLRQSLDHVSKFIYGTDLLAVTGADAQNDAIDQHLQKLAKRDGRERFQMTDIYGVSSPEQFFTTLYSWALKQNPKFNGFRSVEEMQAFIQQESVRMKKLRGQEVNAQNLSGVSDEDLQTMAQAAQRAKQIRDRVRETMLVHEQDDVAINEFMRNESVMSSAGVNMAGLTIQEKGHEDVSFGSELHAITTDPSRKPDMQAIKKHLETMSSVPIPEYPK